MSDYRDSLIEHLADDELRAVDTAATFREIARVALARLHKQHVEHERLRGVYSKLRDEHREHRARTIEGGEVKLPTIPITGDLAAMAEHAWAAIGAANDPEIYFRFAGLPSRIERDDQGGRIVRPLTVDRMRYTLARVARWTEVKGRGRKLTKIEAPPPLPVTRDLLAHPDPPLPRLDRITAAPCFDAGGRLAITPGYHSGIYYAPADDFFVPSVSTAPTKNDIARARSLLAEALLDFPFVGDAEYAHAIAAALLPFVREMVDGPTPLHLFEKPQPGSGATLLVHVLLCPRSAARCRRWRRGGTTTNVASVSRPSC